MWGEKGVDEKIVFWARNFGKVKEYNGIGRRGLGEAKINSAVVGALHRPISNVCDLRTGRCWRGLTLSVGSAGRDISILASLIWSSRRVFPREISARCRKRGAF